MKRILETDTACKSRDHQNVANLKARHDFVARVSADRKLSRTAACVATTIALTHYNSKTGRCDPSLATLAREVGATKRGVIKALKKLQEEGYVEIILHGGTAGLGGRTNSYRPVFESGGRATTPAHDNGQSGERQDTYFADRSGERQGIEVVNSGAVSGELASSPKQRISRTGNITHTAKVIPINPGVGKQSTGVDEQFARFWEV